MWILVMFDLPVTLKKERKAATDFRNTLLDLGFTMNQFSVYLRYCTSQKEVDTFSKKIEAALPEGVMSTYSPSQTNSMNAYKPFTDARNKLQKNRLISSIYSDFKRFFMHQKHENLLKIQKVSVLLF